ncbi:hypothetical protein Tco_1384565 [Tanacetum coccineum]
MLGLVCLDSIQLSILEINLGTVELKYSFVVGSVSGGGGGDVGVGIGVGVDEGIGGSGDVDVGIGVGVCNGIGESEVMDGIELSSIFLSCNRVSSHNQTWKP